MLKAHTTVNTFLLSTDDKAQEELDAASEGRPSASISDATARLFASRYKDLGPNFALLARGRKFRIPDLRNEILEGDLPSEIENALLGWLDLHEWLINPTHEDETPES